MGMLSWLRGKNTNNAEGSSTGTAVMERPVDEDASNSAGAGVASAETEAKPDAFEIDDPSASFDAIEDPDDAELVLDAPAPRNKQELLTELRKNYSEMVQVIRKVNAHLDVQDERSLRLIEIAERIPEALSPLPELRDKTGQLHSAVESLTEIVSRTGQQSEELSTAQLGALQEVRSLLEQTASVEQGIAHSLGEFNTQLSSMNEATGGLAVAISDVHHRQDAREERLAVALTENQKMLTWIVGLCGVGVVAALAIAVVAFAG